MTHCLFIHKYANLTKLNVFVHEHENLLEIEKSFLSFLLFDFEKEKIKINKINAEGFEEKKIIILETTLIKESHINKFLKNQHHVKVFLSSADSYKLLGYY